MNALELSEFSQLKSIVTNGLKVLRSSYLEVSEALQKIKEKKLYRQSGKTWEEFCEIEWGIGSRMANNYVNSGLVAKELTEKTGTKVPLLSAARELEKVPEKKREEVLRIAAEKGPVTAKAVKEAAKNLDAYTNEPAKKRNAELELEPPEEPKKTFDDTGMVVPDKLIPLWKRNKEVDEIMGFVSTAKGKLMHALEHKDELFKEVNLTAIIAELTAIRSKIKQAQSYAVCAACNGQTPDRCTLCKGKGFISKFKWDSAVPEETRNVRAKIAEKNGWKKK